MKYRHRFQPMSGVKIIRIYFI